MNPELTGVAKSRYFKTDSNIYLHYLDAGEGDPIIFLPGMALSCESFVKQILEFSKTNRVIAIDPRGHGLSSKTPHGNNSRVNGTDAIRLTQALRLKNVIMVGWSAGSQYVWEFGKQSDCENVKGFVTIDMPPKETEADASRIDDDSWWYEMNFKDLSDFEAAFSDPESYETTWREYIQNVMIQHPMNETEMSTIMDLRAQMPYWLCHDLLYSVEVADYTQVAQDIAKKRPYLIFAGNYWGEGRVERYVEKYIPEAQLCVLGGHMMFYEFPDQFNARLREFIDSL